MKKPILIWAAILCLPSLADTFKGYECTKDCSGHRAGYAWAEKKGVAHPSQCTGKSQSFVEGCKAYAEGK